MKLFHTADLHLGKIVNEMSMLDDQIYILNQMIEMLKEEKPDALIIAGDLYDRSVPPARAVDALNEFFSKVILDLKIPILSIAGNHDSGERLDFGGQILMSQGLHIEGVVKKQYRRVTLCDEFGAVDFYLIPYVEPTVARYVFEDERIKTHEDAMKKILDDIRGEHNPQNRAVIIAHGYVTFMSESEKEGKSREEILTESHLEVSDSERPLSIGGTDLMSGKIFDGFHYVALGHLHGSQKVGSDRIRYSGSPLKYSFSEEKQKKSMTVVTLDGEGEVHIEKIAFRPIRDMRTIQGNIEEVISKEFYQKANTDDYVFVSLTDSGEVFEPMSKLRSVYPNVMGVRRANLSTLDYQEIHINQDHRTKSKLELFKDFYENVTQREFTADRENWISEVIEIVEREEV